MSTPEEMAATHAANQADLIVKIATARDFADSFGMSEVENSLQRIIDCIDSGQSEKLDEVIEEFANQ